MSARELELERENSQLHKRIKELEDLVADKGLPLAQAKHSCKAAWEATKQQCERIKGMASKGVKAVKKTMRESGKLIKNTIMATLKGGNSTNSTALKLGEDEAKGQSIKALRKAAMSVKAHTMAHAACQGLWQEVEGLCKKVDDAAARGNKVLAEIIKDGAKAFKSRLLSVLKKKPEAKANTTRVQSQFAEDSDEVELTHLDEEQLSDVDVTI